MREQCCDGAGKPAPAPGTERGFTLIELLIALTIVAILAKMASSYYINQIRESRRSYAKTALLDLASREERFMATNGYYTQSAPSLYSGGAVFPIYVPNATPSSDPYSINVTATSTAFTATATINTNSNQVNDACGNYSLDNLGTQSNTGSASGCW